MNISMHTVFIDCAEILTEVAQGLLFRHCKKKVKIKYLSGFR